MEFQEYQEPLVPQDRKAAWARWDFLVRFDEAQLKALSINVIDIVNPD